MTHSLILSLHERAPEFVAPPQNIHRHSEFGLTEVRTSQLIAERLETWGYEVHLGLPPSKELLS